MRASGCCLALLAIAGLVDRSLAQESTDVARAAFDQGTAEFDRGNFAVALENFERAYQLMEHHPRQAYIWNNIGMCQERLGRSSEALASLRRYLADTPPDAPLRAEASDLVRELEVR